MSKLHRKIERLKVNVPKGASAAMGRETTLTHVLDRLDGIRVMTTIEDQPRSLLPGQWGVCAEKALDGWNTDRMAVYPLWEDDPDISIQFSRYCHEQKWWLDHGYLLRNDSALSHGRAAMVPDITMLDADTTAFLFSIPAFFYLRRGEPMKLVVTG